MKDYKISLCTVCMNRLHHIRQTLPQNILDNKDYENIEFVVLDYKSTDGLEEWIRTEMKTYLDSGILSFYKTPTPKYFDRSHSRNLMFNLASGDIISNIDADNFTGKGYASYINDVFKKDNNSIILPDTKRQYYYMRDCVGRFATLKEDFLAVAGYDETMSGYGFEDDDLYERLTTLGRTEEIITDLSFLKVLKHSDEERTKNEFYANNIEDFYISYISLKRSEVFFLYKNGSFEKGIVHAEDNTAAVLVIEDYIWQKGSWTKDTDILQLLVTEGGNYSLKIENNICIEGEKKFYKITNQAFIESLNIQLPLITNQGRYLFNKKNIDYKINQQGFGRGKVYRNFSEECITI